jgi:hypothetical protein
LAPPAPYSSTVNCVILAGTVNVCAEPVKVNTAYVSAVGPAVGVTVGPAVGIAVGIGVGAFVGMKVGTLEGTFVGAQVGPVGASVGAALGPTDQERMPYPSPTFIPVREERNVPLA